MKKIIKTAEQQLREILNKYGVEEEKMESNGDGIYHAVSKSNQAIVVRKDAEDDECEENGIRVEIYPSYEKLRTNKEVLERLHNDAMENQNFEYLGKLVYWEESGNTEYQPHPVNLYYADGVVEVAGGDVLYLTDDEDDFDNGAEYETRHAYMSPYLKSVQEMKDKLVYLINYDFKKGKQIYSDTPVRYADEDGDAESVGANSCVGVALQMSQDDTPKLQLSFIYGDSFECPATSIDVPLEKIPVESLIQIYENLM